MKKNVVFKSHGTNCDAWLFYPQKKEDKYPVIVMAHGLGGTKDLLLEGFAREFVKLGFAVLVFDYRYWGDSEGQPRNMTIYTKLIEDWHSALSYVRSISDLDSQNILLWGTSFAGGLVLTVAAHDHNIKAVISQCPMLDGRASTIEYVKNAGIVASLRSGIHALIDNYRNIMSKEAHYVDILGLPGSIATMATEDGWAFKLLNDKELPHLKNKPFYNKITARTLLNIGNYRPIEDVDKIQCPVLMVICEHDSVAPAAAAKKAANRMKKVHCTTLPLGHFDIYRGAGFDTNIAAQIQFLQEVILKK